MNEKEKADKVIYLTNSVKERFLDRMKKKKYMNQNDFLIYLLDIEEKFTEESPKKKSSDIALD